MTNRALTFGVELEFALAYVPTTQHPHPYPQEPRTTTFPLAPLITSAFSQQRPGERWRYEHEFAIAQDIKHTLTKAGFTTFVEGCADYFDERVDTWNIKTERTIWGPKDGLTSYSWAPVEVVSPAYFFEGEALGAMREVCEVLVSSHCINTNESTGLQVHIGNGHLGFSFHTLQTLIVFLWTFESVLNTLHPEHRQNNKYCTNLQESAEFAMEYFEKFERYPSLEESVQTILSYKDTNELIGKTSTERLGAYNLTGLGPNGRPPRPTIEFRQHEGTLDADAIENWIEACHGIVAYCQKLEPLDPSNVVLLPSFRMQKNGKDDDGVEGSSIKAADTEANITVLELLEQIGLSKQAIYYSKILSLRAELHDNSTSKSGNPNSQEKDAACSWESKNVGESFKTGRIPTTLSNPEGDNDNKEE